MVHLCFSISKPQFLQSNPPPSSSSFSCLFYNKKSSTRRRQSQISIDAIQPLQEPDPSATAVAGADGERISDVGEPALDGVPRKHDCGCSGSRVAAGGIHGCGGDDSAGGDRLQDSDVGEGRRGGGGGEIGEGVRPVSDLRARDLGAGIGISGG